MSGGSAPYEVVIGQALDAAVQHHFESLHEAGVCVPFDQIGDRSRRIVREQLRGTVTAALSVLCRHCMRPPEADGDHSCPCPYRDDECPNHPGLLVCNACSRTLCPNFQTHECRPSRNAESRGDQP